MLIILTFQLKVKCICKDILTVRFIIEYLTGQPRTQVEIKPRGNKHQDTSLDNEETHINPGLDLINRKETNAILLCALVCFEYCLSLSVQIMSLLRSACLQMKGISMFSMLHLLIYFLSIRSAWNLLIIVADRILHVCL